MILAFFGLTSASKKYIHEEIYSLVTYGKGGWTWNDVYSLPVHLRRFYINHLKTDIQKQIDSMESPNTTPKSMGNIPESVRKHFESKKKV